MACRSEMPPLSMKENRRHTWRLCHSSAAHRRVQRPRCPDLQTVNRVLPITNNAKCVTEPCRVKASLKLTVLMTPVTRVFDEQAAGRLPVIAAARFADGCDSSLTGPV